MSTNKLVMCPYDEAHKVKESRLQLHITKCRMNHLSEDRFVCPFNATHVYPRQEKDYHLLHCPDKAPLDRMLSQTVDKNNPFKGRTAVPSYSESVPVVSDEVWDVDLHRVGPRPGYQPPTEPPVNAIFEPPPHSKPAERRRMYQVLHQRQEGTEDTKPLQTVPSPTVVNQPKQPSKPSILQSQMQNYQNLGLGRGRGAVPPTRIAANIFPPQVGPTNQAPKEPNYVSAISSGLSHLGLGRGQSVAAQPNNIFNDDDDFPALGCGRGMNRTPKNNNSYAGVMGNKH